MRSKTKTAASTTPWHALPPDAAVAGLQSRHSGLSSSEVEGRLVEWGRNRLPGARRRGLLVRFLLQFHNVLIYVLLASSAITLALGHVVDSLVIFAVVLANALIGLVQEGRAESAMDAIRQMLMLKASVLRDGRRTSVDSAQVVPGDVVLLEAGDRVPADLRLLRAKGLQIQESVLTGESAAVDKVVAAVAEKTVLGDRTSMAFSGTLVTSGTGLGVVVATGRHTEIGRISNLLSDVQELTTPLVQQMDVFARWLTVLILALAAALLVFGYFVGHHPFEEMFMAVVSLSVAAIPEGLPAVLTITLAVGVRGMARRNAIIRRLPAIETLGSVSVICTDKTGTLTRNEMVVAMVMTRGHEFVLDGDGYAPTGSLRIGTDEIDARDHHVLDEIGRLAVLCNDARLREIDQIWTVEGDPMEGAMLALAGKIGLDARREIAEWARTDEVPFDARHRFMATLNHDHDGHAIISVKGAPESVIALCRDQRRTDGEAEAIDKSYWEEGANAVSARGERVLALASRRLACEHTVLEMGDIKGTLTLLGLIGLADPPRQEAIAAVSECRRAGIGVKMITGDHRGTAVAIGRLVGLEHPDRVLEGYEIDQLDDAGLSTVVRDTDVFARTSPEHKLRIVTALQEHGMTVAMTGDGVNDAPALKRADAGIAMGLKGSEAAKEAAEVVLADDNFASIVAAVREGRTVYDNIKKVISWTMPTSAGEALVILVALLFGLTLPITPIQILWVNLVTAVTLGLALAFEPSETNTMKRPPRKRNAPLIGGELAWHIVLVSTLFLFGVFAIQAYATDRGFAPELVRTMAMNTLVVMEIFHLFFIRNIYGTSLAAKAVKGTPVVWASVVAVTAAQFAVTYVPALQRVFGTKPVPLFDGVLIIGVGVALFAIIEIEKQVRLSLNAQNLPAPIP